MLYRRLGRSDMKASAVGMGCWALGAKGWGPVDERQSMLAVEEALDAGVNFFDTADIYGFGHSEELLGKALRHSPQALIATKVGLKRDNRGRICHDLSASHVKEACGAALRRLRRKHIDLYMIHWPDPAVDISDALAILSTLRDEGKIRYFGACNLDRQDLLAACSTPGFVAYEDRFNILDFKAGAENSSICRENRVAFIGYEPLMKGLLTGKYRERPVFGRDDHRRRLECFNAEYENISRQVKPISDFASRRGLSPAALALAMLFEEATIVVPGAKTAAQARENAGAADIPAETAALAWAELAPSFA